MIRPYLYAKNLFREREKSRESLMADRYFFEAFLGAISSPKVLSFLGHPLVAREKKLETIEAVLRKSGALLPTHEPLLKIWLKKDYVSVLREVFTQWLMIVEDFLKEGVIIVSSPSPLSPQALQFLLQTFLKSYPGRTFSFQLETAAALQTGATARFRDSVLDLRTHVLLKKIILSL